MAAKHIETMLNEGEAIESILNRFAAVFESLKWVVHLNDPSSGRLIGASKTSLWSWGENITIEVDEDGTTHIKSECKLPTQIIDWGNNKKNVNKLLAALDQ